MFDFNDQKALVTGAASGIGLGIAQLLGRSGASLIVVDRNAQGLLAADLPEDCIRVYGDITERDVREEILSYGPIPLSIQNAGIADTEGGFLLGKDQEYLEVFQTNLFAPWSLSREIAKELIRSKQSGSMVMISSLHAHHVRRMPAYSTSKAALEMLIREMAWELGPYGIRVNGVVPGGVRTKLTATGSHARESMFPWVAGKLWKI